MKSANSARAEQIVERRACSMPLRETSRGSLSGEWPGTTTISLVRGRRDGLGKFYG